MAAAEGVASVTVSLRTDLCGDGVAVSHLGGDVRESGWKATWERVSEVQAEGVGRPGAALDPADQAKGFGLRTVTVMIDAVFDCRVSLAERPGLSDLTDVV